MSKIRKRVILTILLFCFLESAAQSPISIIKKSGSENILVDYKDIFGNRVLGSRSNDSLTVHNLWPTVISLQKAGERIKNVTMVMPGDTVKTSPGRNSSDH